ncbi:FAD-binding oxidoreductase [Sphingomonas sp. PL-96]|uniref:NAD(P)/FAD-dependent oxidoreductase n=1 Tax=Sphingomonas sp. PL-96 TaxID=2887201 RepID=UPI001E60AC33|nr:FAD-binding oxidoreductase [Sphingomonas sp. PL-96]MCC2978329.1 FAD-binding oxidoreductase [Sphingomonas sp. PL-96]
MSDTMERWMGMRRRTVIGGAVAVAATMSAGGLAATPRKRVGVVGGGIIGASVAFQLARAGADVFLFEKERPAAGATQASVAWINPVVNDATYMRLRLESMAAWLEDDRVLGLQAVWGGSVSWAYADKEKALRAKAEVLQGTDDPPRTLSAGQIRQTCPGVNPGDGVAFAFQSHKDGHVDPVHATERYLAAAAAAGAKILYPCEVTKILLTGSRVTGVRTSKGDFPLDMLVSATGTDTPHIMAMAGKQLQLAHKPGLVIHTDAQPVVTDKVFEASSLIEFKQYADGRFLTSFTGGPPDLPVHAEVLKRQMQHPSEELRQFHGQMLIARTAEYIPAIGNAQPVKILVGFRPYPLDNRPICGPVPGVEGLYTIVTHSGITLAPILGRYAAQEIATGRQAPSLAPYRPSRYIAA